MTNIFSYILRYDLGFAPNPFHGYCTLATCKPKIREYARPGDWVVGLGSRSGTQADKLVYAMRVEEKMTYNEYWLDGRFTRKRPRYDGSLKQAYGDNIYHQSPDGAWGQIDSHHSEPDGTPNTEHANHDTQTNAVLISRRFSYFGSDAVDFKLLSFLMPGAPRSHRRNSDADDPEVVKDLAAELGGLPRGLIGRPSGWPKIAEK